MKKKRPKIQAKSSLQVFLKWSSPGSWTVLDTTVLRWWILSNCTIWLLKKARGMRTMPTKNDQIRIDYTITFETLFHFGTGIRSSLIDRTVRRDSQDYLFLPGSNVIV